MSVLNILNVLYNLHFFSSKCRFFKMLPCLVSVLLTFYIQGVLKFEKNSVTERLMTHIHQQNANNLYKIANNPYTWTTCNKNGGTAMNIIQVSVSITSVAFTCLYWKLPLFNIVLCELDISMLYSCMLMYPWGWWFITETWTVHVCGEFVIYRNGVHFLVCVGG